MSVASLAGLSVYITGDVPGMVKPDAEALIAKAGAYIASGMTKSLDLLIVAPKAGPKKLENAQRWNIPTIGWDEALALASGNVRSVHTAPAPEPVVRHQPVQAQNGYRQIKPMLCLKADELPAGDGWIFEPKLDGYRCIAHLDGAGNVILASRTGKQLIDYPHVVAELERLNVPCVLDGEMAVLDENGCCQFERLQKGEFASAKFLVYDVLETFGSSVKNQPLAARRELLEDILEGGAWVAPIPQFEDGEVLLEWAAANEQEGVVAKRANSIYREGARGDTWLKIKLRPEQEFVVAGYTPGKGRRAGLPGALLLAVYDDACTLIYCGSVGTGGNDDEWRALMNQLTPITQLPFPLHTQEYERVKGDFTGPELRDITWVDPTVVVRVEFQRWTAGGKLFHPSLQGTRDDKDAADVRKET